MEVPSADVVVDALRAPNHCAIVNSFPEHSMDLRSAAVVSSTSEQAAFSRPRDSLVAFPSTNRQSLPSTSPRRTPPVFPALFRKTPAAQIAMVTNTEEEDDSQEDTINYKAKYRSFKRKLKFLIYENECFQETLRINQRKMLKVSRDKNFLLDRLLNYEKVEVTSSEGEDTESSEDEIGRADAKRRKVDMGLGGSMPVNSGSSSKTVTPAKKKKPPPKMKSSSHPQLQTIQAPSVSDLGSAVSSSEEIQRHFENRARFSSMDIDKPPSMPSELFSNDPSLDSESNEIGEMETSPSNLGEDCLSAELILPD